MKTGELEVLLEGLRSRGAIKGLGERADREPALRRALVDLADRRGLEIDDTWPGKRLVRALLARQEPARTIKNPVRRDEGFRCLSCGRLVEPGGRRVRDHCPHCLRGLHADRVPGDRAADCGGLLDPVALTLEGRAGVVIHYRCRKCGAHWRGRAHPDDRVPPSLDVCDITFEVAGEVSAVDDRARTLPRRVTEAIRAQRLWAPGDFVVLAVSGGLDSMVLLELAWQDRGAHGGRLLVASLDHGLRPESVAEVAAVGRVARQLGLPFASRRLDLAAGPNLQARARDARRAALLAIAAEAHAEHPGGELRIATAHHEDDQAETVLYHLLRGSGPAGLRGMLPLDPPWCRPLLHEPRAVLAAWARERGLRWTEDPSNPASQRGRIRALMPALDGIHGGAAAALARSARLLAREDAFMERLTDEAWPALARDGGLDVARLAGLDPALQLRLLRRLAAACSGPLRADQLEAFLGWTPRGNGRLGLPGGWSLVLVAGVLRLEAPEP